MHMAEVDEVGVGGNDDCKDETVGRLPSINLNRTTIYLTPNARQAFTQLRQVFTKAQILRRFDPKYHIQIETDASGYAIGDVLSQLTLDNLGLWHLIAYNSQKIILAKTRYKTYNSKLLAIVDIFKTWKHYLKSCKHKVLMLIDHNNFCRFMDIKSPSFCQVC